VNAQVEDFDDVGDDDGRLASDDADIIAEAKKRLKLCIEFDGHNHEQGLADLKFLSGDQWDEAAKRQREIDGRPCLTINKLPTFIHQVTNDVRQNLPGAKVSGVSEGTDVDSALVVEGIIRHIEYASNADVAYDTAVSSAAAHGEGYFRLVTEYCKPDSWDQDIKYKRIRNPFTVYCDPASQEPDGSDSKFWLISADVPKYEFKSEYPDAKGSYEAFDTGTGDRGTWLTEDTVKVCEYYRIVETPDTLVELTNGESGLKSKLLEMPKGVKIKRSRPTSIKTVEWYKLTTHDVLETTIIKCDWIPVFPVYGDELDIDGKVIRSGLVRHSKSSQQMYNVWMTSATEEIGMRNRTPYIGAEGQFEGYEDEWGQANVRSYPYMEYKPVTLEGNLAPAPSRQPMADVPQGVLTMAAHAADDIKATTGLFDSSLGNRGNATSGIQERAQQRQGDVANFHYADNLNRAVRQSYRCLISMIPNYLDTARIVKIMGEDRKVTPAKVNTPQTQLQPVPAGQQPPPQAQVQVDPETGQMMAAITTIENDLSVGEYDVTVSTGPAYSTLRQEAADAMVQVGKNWPKLMDVAGDKVIGAMDWPGAEEIAERIKRTIPPNILGPDEDDANAEPMVQTPKGPIPASQAGQMLDQMNQQMQQMGQELAQAKSGITKAQIETASAEKIATMEIQAEQAREAARVQAEQAREAARVQAEAAKAALDNTVKLDIAELNGMVQLLVGRAKANDALKADVNSTLSGDASATPPTPTAANANKAELAAAVKQ
jgi:hypothetical protein